MLFDDTPYRIDPPPRRVRRLTLTEPATSVTPATPVTATSVTPATPVTATPVTPATPHAFFAGPLHSRIAWLSDEEAVECLRGLPEAIGYETVIKPLRYRQRPHLSALTEFDDRRITLTIPEPFLPFGEIVQYGAKRLPATGRSAAAKRMRFVWLSEGLTFREPREVLRFLWCHEWFHWFLYEVLHRKSQAETACDRFALHNYLRDDVTLDDAYASLRRGPRPS